MIGWQEIIALGLVVCAVLLLVRKTLGRGSDSIGGCGTCAAPDTSPDREVKITELHQVQIEHRLPHTDNREE